MAHTPKPWIVDQPWGPRVLRIRGNSEADMREIARLTRTERGLQQDLDNARVMAESPNLLEAWEFAVEWLENLRESTIALLVDTQPVDKGGLSTIRNAIFEARGLLF